MAVDGVAESAPTATSGPAEPGQPRVQESVDAAASGAKRPPTAEKGERSAKRARVARRSVAAEAKSSHSSRPSASEQPTDQGVTGATCGADPTVGSDAADEPLERPEDSYLDSAADPRA